MGEKSCEIAITWSSFPSYLHYKSTFYVSLPPLFYIMVSLFCKRDTHHHHLAAGKSSQMAKAKFAK